MSNFSKLNDSVSHFCITWRQHDVINLYNSRLLVGKSHMTAIDNPVTKVLNRFNNRAFIEALTERDRTVRSELVEEILLQWP